MSIIDNPDDNLYNYNSTSAIKRFCKMEELYKQEFQYSSYDGSQEHMSEWCHVKSR